MFKIFSPETSVASTSSESPETNRLARLFSRSTPTDWVLPRRELPARAVDPLEAPAPLPSWLGNIILRNLSSLDPRLAAILRCHYGLADDAPFSLAAVAERFRYQLDDANRLKRAALAELQRVLALKRYQAVQQSADTLVKNSDGDAGGEN